MQLAMAAVRKKSLASPAPPIQKLVRDKTMWCRDINLPRSRCDALSHNPSVHLVWLLPVSAERLNNLTSTDKTSPNSCHAASPSVSTDIWQ